MKQKAFVGAIFALCFAMCTGVSAAERKVTGTGKVDGILQFFSQDMSYLEGEIAGLMEECGKELSDK